MVMRRIIEATIGPRSTRIRLDCGHERSIGGHRFPNGDRADKPSELLGRPYDCQDGLCLGRIVNA